MCVAITMMAGSVLAEDEIVKMGRANADGVGVSWVHGGRVHWQKAVRYSPKYVTELISRWRHVPRLVHFRLSTAGGTRSDLCHPFEISPVANCNPSGSGDRVMIHNGHWGQWDDLLKILKKEDLLPDEGPWSDTRLVAYLSHSDPDWLNVLGGKVAVMSGDGQTTHLGDWNELREGIKVSNFHWNTESGYKRGGYAGYRQWRGWEWGEGDWAAFEAEKRAQEEERKVASIKAAQARRDEWLAKQAAEGKDKSNAKHTGKSDKESSNGTVKAEKFEQIEAARKARTEGKPEAGWVKEADGSLTLTLSQTSDLVLSDGAGGQLAGVAVNANSVANAADEEWRNDGDGAVTPGEFSEEDGTSQGPYAISLKAVVGARLTRSQRKFFGRSRQTGTGMYDTRPWRNPVSGRIYQVGDDGRVVEVTAAYSTAGAAANAIEAVYYDDGHCGELFDQCDIE